MPKYSGSENVRKVVQANLSRGIDHIKILATPRSKTTCLRGHSPMKSWAQLLLRLDPRVNECLRTHTEMRESPLQRGRGWIRLSMRPLQPMVL